jgi:hypothetical protein
MDAPHRRSSNSNSGSSTFLLGQDSSGHWVVQDEQRLWGGIFFDRVEAVKFAMFEPSGQPRAVILVPGIFELDMGEVPSESRLSHRKRSIHQEHSTHHKRHEHY